MTGDRTAGPSSSRDPGWDRLAAACLEVAAPGTDVALLASVMAWAVRPRRSLDAIRRRCRDAEVSLCAGATPTAAIREVVTPHVDAGDAAAAAPLVEAWSAAGVRVALVGDVDYPTRLAEGWPQTDGPTLLAWRGTPIPDVPTVAIVGARRATGYGTAVAAWLAEAAAAAGVRIVSGGAVGIDAAAHTAAVELPGGTTVVLGCGHGIAYPRVHARPGGLFDRVVDHAGAVASELLPQEPPRAGQVRSRNRIVAGLADVVVVVEGGERSGALLTAGAAAERGRTVLAVPGDVRADGSVAPHRLLAEGAAPCTGPPDLFEALGSDASTASDGIGEAVRPGPSVLSTLPDDVHALLAARWPRPVRIDDLARTTGRAIGPLLAAVTRARVAGEVADGAEGIRLRRAPR
jgi:DNA processing protein